MENRLICSKHKGTKAASPGGYLPENEQWLVCHAPANVDAAVYQGPENDPELEKYDPFEEDEGEEDFEEFEEESDESGEDFEDDECTSSEEEAEPDEFDEEEFDEEEMDMQDAVQIPCDKRSLSRLIAENVNNDGAQAGGFRGLAATVRLPITQFVIFFSSWAFRFSWRWVLSAPAGSRIAAPRKTLDLSAQEKAARPVNPLRIMIGRGVGSHAISIHLQGK